MLVRVKDFCGSIQPLKEHVGLFGDRLGDDCLTPALVELAGIDKAKGQFKFIASTDAVDHDDEVIAAGAFHELRHTYLGNPVILADHQHRLANGNTTLAANCLQLQTERNPVWGVGEMADTAVGRDRAAVVLAGKQRGISVGFRSRDIDRSTGRLVHTKALLLKISLVAVPANSQALVLTYVQGRLGQYGQRAIQDPVQADEWEHMLREIHAQLDRLCATLGPEAVKVPNISGVGTAIPDADLDAAVAEAEGEKLLSELGVTGGACDADDCEMTPEDVAFAKAEVDECLYGTPIGITDEFADDGQEDDRYGAALVRAAEWLDV